MERRHRAFLRCLVLDLFDLLQRGKRLVKIITMRMV